jgi:hypothetical protein
MACTLSEDERPLHLCPHLAGEADPEAYVVWFTGHGKDLNWVCEVCARRYPLTPVEWVPVPERWLDEHSSNLKWEGIHGQPEVRVLESRIRFEHRNINPLKELFYTFVDAQPCPTVAHRWYALCTNGHLVVFDSQIDKPLGVIDTAHRCFGNPEFTADVRLCISPRNDFAAIYQEFGSHAVLLELPKFTVTAHLTRGNYYVGASRFPVAFFVHDGRTLAMAGSEWNRLDIYDPKTGISLTERGPTACEDGKRPVRYLEYFHGELCVSPNNTHVMECGWIWGGCNLWRWWDIEAWMRNVWESEDGTSLTYLAAQESWSGTCWIDDTMLAVCGWGLDEWALPAIVLMDVQAQGKTLRWFPGLATPGSRSWPGQFCEHLFFDKYLFAVSAKVGTTVWNIATGERLHLDGDTKPRRYHPLSKEFLAITDTGFRISRLLEA